MILLDAYALVAFLAGSAAAPHVRALLRDGAVAVATANVAEALDVVQRIHGVSTARSWEVLDPLFGSALTARGLDLPIAYRAAEIRAAHYHRKTCPISLADAVLLASTTAADRIATADPDVLAVARSEGLKTVELPQGG